ncbi:hypothetical protein C8Q70DRAFT_510186 [Cubamyces menziesii]|nr:hypothetical protein C8Q70DRAFT_510186 [Cubamyces menziesii]
MSPGVDPLPVLPQVPSLKDTYGAVLIGTYVSLMLYGVTLHQAYRYSRLSTSDSSATKWSGFCNSGGLIADLRRGITHRDDTSGYSTRSTRYCACRCATGTPYAAGCRRSINVLSVVVGVAIICCQCSYVRRIYLSGRQYWYLHWQLSSACSDGRVLTRNLRTNIACLA